MIKIELHTGKVLFVNGISSDPMRHGYFILQHKKRIEYIDLKTIKHISSC